MHALPLVVLFVIRPTPGFAFQAAAVAMPGLIANLGLDHAQAGLVLGAFIAGHRYERARRSSGTSDQQWRRVR